MIDGNPLPQAPEWIANFTLRYGMPVGNGELLRLHRLGLPQRSELLPVRVGRVHRQAACSRAACASATTGATASTKWPCSAATSPTRKSRVGGIDFNNLTGFINEPRIWGVQFKASF